MTFFFDRSLGVVIPKALKRLKPPVGVEYHQEHFAQDARDDVWLPSVGARGWVVVSQDYRYHLRQTELAAIKQHGMGCFYLWGSDAGKWETMRVFAKAYDRIVDAATLATRPFVFRILKPGSLKQIQI